MQNQDSNKAPSGPSRPDENKDENQSKHQANRNERKDGEEEEEEEEEEEKEEEEEEEKEEEEEEEEHFPKDFQCCICLDLLFKPVVLACGHMACFWCLYNAMNFWHGSQCPICRYSFHHFPNVCRLLHFLLLKLYPIAYKRRERQVGEEEKKMGHFSTQLSNRCGGFGASSDSLHVPIQTQAQLSSQSSSAGFSNGVTENCSLSGKKPGNEVQKQVSVVDLLCDECNNLLFRPVVLNCGHVCCESCIIIPVEGIPKCQICQSVHPNGFPKVCLYLEHFLEKYFPKLYSARWEGLHCQDMIRAQHEAGHSSSAPTNVNSSQRFGDWLKVHGGIGCDSCGMCPILGERYRCKDCVEKVGFDLCETCYNNPSKLSGRFNQQHKPEHNFEIVPPRTIQELMFLLNLVRSDEDDSNVGEDAEDALLASESPEAVSQDVGGGPDDARDSSATLNDSDA